jgi:hypothetical protein
VFAKNVAKRNVHIMFALHVDPNNFGIKENQRAGDIISKALSLL